MPKLVIFDLDETLLFIPVDWEKAKAEILELAKKRGIPADSSLGIAELSNSISSNSKIKSEIDAIWSRRELETLDKKGIIAYPKATAFLASLKKRGMRIAVCSNNCHSSIERALLLAGLPGFVDFIVGRDDVERPKPDPQMLLVAIQRAGVSKEDSVFLGDSIRDIEAGRRAGIRAVKIFPEADFPGI